MCRIGRARAVAIGRRRKGRGTRCDHRELGAARLFARMQDLDRSSVEDKLMLGASDSMPTDREGNVYIAQYGAARMLVATPAGKLLRILSVPPEYLYATNCAFSPDEWTIYITASRDQDNAPYPGAVTQVENR